MNLKDLYEKTLDKIVSIQTIESLIKAIETTNDKIFKLSSKTAEDSKRNSEDHTSILEDISKNSDEISSINNKVDSIDYIESVSGKGINVTKKNKKVTLTNTDTGSDAVSKHDTKFDHSMIKVNTKLVNDHLKEFDHDKIDTAIQKETDPLFKKSPANDIKKTDINKWDKSYKWGDHKKAGYLTKIDKKQLESSIEQINETPNEIRDKLESLSGVNRLDAKAIKNLPEPKETVKNIYHSSPGVATFKDLIDTPNSYIGDANELLQVNDAANGVEFSNTIKKDLVFDGVGIQDIGYVDADLVNEYDDKVGRLKWNDTEKCWEYTSYIDPETGEGTTNQIGQETWVRCRNNTGSTIPNGAAVYVSGAIGNRPTIALARADDIATSLTFIGLVTNDIGNNEDGMVTVRGTVNGMNTNNLTTGLIAYLSTTTAGGLTNTRPTPGNGNQIIGVGISLFKSGGDGKFAISAQIIPTLRRLSDVYSPSVPNDGDTVYWDAANERFATNYNLTAGKETTGFDEPENVTITGDPTNRTVTLTGSFTAYWRGVVVDALTDGWESDAHGTDTNSNYFLYYNGTDFTWSTSVWTFDMLQIAYAWYDPTNATWAYQREPHGLMPWEAHEEFHEVVGTYRESGGDLSDYTLNDTTAAERRPLVSEAKIDDEDVDTTVPALSSEVYTQYYLSGADGDANFQVDMDDIVPLSGNQPYWNEYTGGTWQQTLMSNNYYMAIWLVAVPMAADTTSQKYRFLWLQGQTQALLESTIQGRTPSDLTFGAFENLSPEFITIAKVIIRYQGGNWFITEVTNLTGNRYIQTGSPAGSYLSSVSTDSTITGTGTVTDPLSIGQAVTITSDVTFNDLTISNPSNIYALSHDSFADVSGVGSGVTYGHVSDQAETFYGNKTFNDNLTVTGNLTVNGTTFTSNTETVQIEDNLAIINNGETGAGITAGFAGWEADRGTLANYRWGFEESTDLWKIGEVGNLQAVTTRADSPTNTGIMYWNDATSQILNSANATLDASGNADFGGDVTAENLYAVCSDCNSYFYADSGSGTDYYVSGFNLRHGGSTRWNLYKNNDSAGDFLFARYNDSGVYQDSPIRIYRTDGNVRFYNKIGIGTVPDTDLHINGSAWTTASQPTAILESARPALVFYDNNSASNNVTGLYQSEDVFYIGITNYTSDDYGWNEITNAIVINSNPYVGIHTNVPATPLHIKGLGLSSFTGTSGGILTIENSNNTADEFIAIDFRNDAYTSNNPLARIAAKITASGSELHLGTSDAYGSGIDNTTMIINNTNVGIGTTSSTEGKLIIGYNSASPQIYLEGTGSTNTEIYMDASSELWILNNLQDNGLKIYDGGGGVDILYNGSARAEFDSSGGMKLNLTTENIQITDAGSTSATEQDWIEVKVGSTTGYIRVYSSK